MKRMFATLLPPFLLLFGVLSACTINEPSLPATETSSTGPTLTPSPIEIQSWQDAYAELLRESSGQEFFLVDIDNDGIPELLVGGQMIDWGKYAEYYVYTYTDNTLVHLGEISTLSWSCLWIDNNNGILGSASGAGGGGIYRSYIEGGILNYDGEVYEYYNDTVWFRDSDGNMVIVTEETEDEFQRMWDSLIELESYEITEANIARIVYKEN